MTDVTQIEENFCDVSINWVAGNSKQNHSPKLSPDDKIDDLRTALTDIGAKLSVDKRVHDCVQGGLCHLGEDRLQVSCSAFFLFTSWSMEALIPLTHWSQVIDTSSGAAQVGPHIHSAWNWKPHNHPQQKAYFDNIQQRVVEFTFVVSRWDRNNSAKEDQRSSSRMEVMLQGTLRDRWPVGRGLD